MFNLTKKEEEILKKLNTPAKIQDFLNKIPINFDYNKDTCLSPREVLRKWKCHCIEGAIFAALALQMQGRKPLIVHLKASKDDYDHVIAVFQEDGKWGAITKTNHGVLRYREPIYKDIRELVMSFFHEYFNNKGRKALRSYSVPVDLSIFDKKKWTISEKDLWYIDTYLDKVKHFSILTKKQIKNLRKADKIERKIGKVVEWKRRRKNK
ncbi:MAG: hypothetical protein PHH54_01350 [Candidatus Nanoarchaeia archaeon]|nr:hypothetical protein [Candidatus Nanoarchaeia archaeon]MDD5740609.1 hypothetical protein [Candidatus Nanoarchaeia archaeon]